MSKFNSEDLYFDVNKFGGKKNIQSSYPELLPYKEVSDIKPDEWKVAILYTDIGSPFVKIKDPLQKTEEIFDALGLDRKSKHKQLFNDIVQQRISGVTTACTFLIEYQNNHEFASWFSLNKLYYKFIKQLDKPMTEEQEEDLKELKKRKDIQKDLDEMQVSLKKYETNLFGTAAMKADTAYKAKKRILNWNEKFAVENQVE